MARVRQDYGKELLASGLEPAELAELREWFCYTKPMGPSVRITATPASGGFEGFCVVAAGNQPDACDEPFLDQFAGR